jgi:hypothetical protein
VHVAYVALPGLLLITGAWLLWLPLLERTRPWFAQRGASITTRLLGR